MKRSAKQSSTLDGRGRSANLVQLFNLTGTDSVSSLVRRAGRRHRHSSDWRKTMGEIPVSDRATRRPKVSNIAGDLRSAVAAGSETLAEREDFQNRIEFRKD
jgi:hypothetical protein